MDEQFPYAAEDSRHDGGKNELILRQKDQTLKETTAIKSPVRDVKLAHETLPNGQQFLREGQGYNQKESLNPVQEKESPNITLGSYLLLQPEKELETDTGFVGFQPSTTAVIRQYPQEGSIAVFLRGMSAQPRSRPIQLGDNHGVWAYEEVIERWESLLKPSVQCFTKNMEDEIPHELIKIGREE